MVRKMLAEMQQDRARRSRETVVKSINPFIRSCVSIARNCSKIDILLVQVAGAGGAGAAGAGAGAGAVLVLVLLVLVLLVLLK